MTLVTIVIDIFEVSSCRHKSVYQAEKLKKGFTHMAQISLDRSFFQRFATGAHQQ